MLCCSLHSPCRARPCPRCSSHSFSVAAPSPSQPCHRDAFPSFTLPLPCRSLPISALACQSKACVTTPLPFVSSVCFAAANPCFASPLPCPPRPSVHILRVAYPSLSVANIASHAPAKPVYSLPLRSVSKLCCAIAWPLNAVPRVAFPSPHIAFQSRCRAKLSMPSPSDAKPSTLLLRRSARIRRNTQLCPCAYSSTS